MTLLIVTIGLSGLLAQVMLLRELLVSFYGNELTLGIILANWVAAEALGVFLVGKLVDRSKDPYSVFATLQVVFCAGLVACLYAARAYKHLLGIPAGEGIGLGLICAVSLVVVLPAAFCHGGLFSAVCLLDARRRGANGAALSATLGRVYAWEIIGTVAGGFLATWVILPHVRLFDAAAALISANCAVSLLALRGAGGRSVACAWLLLALSLSAVVASPRLEQSSQRLHYPWGELLEARASVHGSLAVTRQQEQYTFYVNGLPVITTPHPDAAFVEDFVHLPMLMHSAPWDVLVLGSGAGGLLREVLKHPVRLVDYVELDPLLIELLRRYPTPITAQELSDPRVRVLTTDGRYYLRASARAHARASANAEAQGYDVCFIGYSRPSDLASNRYFTLEFFRLLKTRLRPGGIVALRMPGSLTHIGPEMGELNGMLLRTLRAVFPSVRVVPGDYTLYIASADSEAAGLVSATARELRERIASRGISLEFISGPYLEYRLKPEFAQWFAQRIPVEGPLNADSRPRAVFTMNLLWNKEFSPRFFAVLKKLDQLNPPLAGGAAAAAGIAALIGAGFFCARRRSTLLGWTIASTGFFGMLSSLILVVAFQTHFGNLYRYVGALTGLFMLGSAAGSFAMTRLLSRVPPRPALLAGCEGLVIAYVLALPWAIGRLDELGGQAGWLFCALFLLAGAFLGMEFPLAAGLTGQRVERAGETSGFLYFVDLAGGWIAGMIGGVLLVPLLGIGGACLVMVVMKSGSFIGMLRQAPGNRTAGAAGPRQ